MPIHCEIVSQDKPDLFDDDVDIVILPGKEGVMGILPNHTPLLTVLQFGVITVRKGGIEEYFTVAGGVAEVQPNQVTILADAAENVAEIDVERAERARSRAEEALKKGVAPNTDAYLKIQSSLRKSTLRIDAVRRFRQNPRRR